MDFLSAVSKDDKSGVPWAAWMAERWAAEMAVWWVCRMVGVRAVMWVLQQVDLTADETVGS